MFNILHTWFTADQIWKVQGSDFLVLGDSASITSTDDVQSGYVTEDTKPRMQKCSKLISKATRHVCICVCKAYSLTWHIHPVVWYLPPSIIFLWTCLDVTLSWQGSNIFRLANRTQLSSRRRCIYYSMLLTIPCPLHQWCKNKGLKIHSSPTGE